MDTARASSTAGSSSQALCLYLRHTQEVDGRSRLICIITSSLISGSLVSPQQWLLAFGIFVHFLSSFWYFQAGKETETSPSDIPDCFRCAAFRSIASLSSFSLPAPRAGGNTAHQRDRISASQRCLYLAISLSHGWCLCPAPEPPWRRRHGRWLGPARRGRALLQTLETFFMYSLIETKETFSAPTSSATNCSIER